MRVRHFVVAASLLALAVAPALAQGTGDRNARFGEWDSNGDGVLQKTEFRGHPGNFDAMDANHDRVLSREEFVSRYRMDDSNPTAVPPAPPVAPVVPVAPPAPPAAPDPFATVDLNHDGHVTPSEWRASPFNLAAADFVVYDANDDGRINREEHAQVANRTSRPSQFADRDLNNDGFLSRREWTNVEPVPFDRLDRDRDSRVSWEEYRDPSRASSARDTRFDDMDRNGDGRLSRREMGSDRDAFDRLDRNNDGEVTYAEYDHPAAEGNERARFDELDRNNDRSISRREWEGDGDAFDDLDANRDGRLTLSEYDDRREDYDDRRELETRFRSLDRNRDGWVTRNEWRDSSSDFNRLDRNRDGRLSTAELLPQRQLEP